MEQWKLAAVMGAVALGGVALGGWLFGSPPAYAQRVQYTECFIARQESVDTNDRGEIAGRGQNRLVRVPPGYTPIGGGGLRDSSGPVDPTGSIIFCR